MRTIEAFLANLVDRVEGGRYTNDPADKGGPTRWGITQKTLARFRGHPVTDADVAALGRDEALAIYRRMYVEDPGFDMIAALSMPIALELIDTGVNMSPGVATKYLQRVVNVLNHGGRAWPDLTVDGICGAMTAGALGHLLNMHHEDGERVVLTALNCLQGAQYIHLAEAIPANERFVRGWLQARVVMPA